MADTPQPVADVADRYFCEGFNCAQAVLRAVTEATGLACPQCIPGIALAMGGGVAQSGGVCGAVTGGVMVIGLAMDGAAPGDLVARKRAAYEVAGRFVQAFADRVGCVDCRDILGFVLSEPGGMDRFRGENALQLKCVPCVRWAAAEALRIVVESQGNQRRHEAST
jgi:C_GCAxxG_C_C family probable redox protein